MKKSSKTRKLWLDVTPEMMTEEETGTENNYIRHRQSWRSNRFNLLMEKLDGSKNVRSLAKQREVGETVFRSPPIIAMKWMLNASDTQETDHSDQETDHSDNQSD